MAQRRRQLNEEQRAALTNLALYRAELAPRAAPSAPVTPPPQGAVTRQDIWRVQDAVRANRMTLPDGRTLPRSEIRASNITTPTTRSRSDLEHLERDGVDFGVPYYDPSVSPFAPYNINTFRLRSSVGVRDLTTGLWNLTKNEIDEAREVQKDMNFAERWLDNQKRGAKYTLNTGKFIAEAAVGFTQSVLLSGGELGVGLAERLNRAELPAARDHLEWLKGNALMGQNGGSVTYQDYYNDTVEHWEKEGFTPTVTDKSLLTVGVLGLAAVDLWPGGRGTRSFAGTVKTLAKAEAPDLIRQQVQRNLRFDITDAGLTAIRATDDPVTIARILEAEKKLADLRKIPVERRTDADIMRATQAQFDIRQGYLSEVPTYRRAEQFPTTSRQVVSELEVKGKYPEWVPKDIRSRRAVDSALQGWNRGVRPTRGRAVQLYDLIERQVLDRMNLAADPEYLKVARYADEAKRLQAMVAENKARFKDNPEDYVWLMNNRRVNIEPDYKRQLGKYEFESTTNPAALNVYDKEMAQVLRQNDWKIDETGVWADPISAFNRELVTTSDGVAIQNAAALIANPEVPLVAKGSAYQTWRRGMQERLDALTRNFINNKIDVNRFETATTGRQADNPYAQGTAETTSLGEALATQSERARNMRKVVEDGAQKLQEASVVLSQKHGMETLQFNRYIGDYLHAMHAPETNARFGKQAAGMTDAQAKAIREGIEKLPAGSDIIRQSQRWKEFLGNPVDDLLDAGYITREQYDEIMAVYENYVPLYRAKEGVSASEFITEEFSLRPLRERTGSELDVTDIQKNIVDLKRSVQETILQHEIDRKLLSVVDENIARGMGDVQKVKPKFTEDVTAFRQRPEIYSFYTNGKYQYLEFRNPAVAMAMKGAFSGEVKQKQIRTALMASRAVARFVGQAATSYNLTFGPGNMFRDMGEAYYYLRAEGQIKGVGHAQFARDQAVAVRQAFDYVRGKDTAGAKLYREMVEHGGMGGSITNVIAPELGRGNFDKMYESLRRGQGVDKGRQVMQTIGKNVKAWNDVWEGATRLNVYKRALDNGLSPERAGVAAKQATLNFDRRGQYTSVMGSLWVFVNAGAQGVDRLARIMRNPKVAAEVATTYMVAEAAISSWNDSVDPEWRSLQSDYERNNRWSVALPGFGGGTTLLSLPVPIPLAPIKAAWSAGLDVTRGEADAGEFASRLKDATLNAIDPIGGVDSGFLGLAPTGIKPFVEAGVNTAWHGGPIWNDYIDKDLPKYTRAFDSMDDRASSALIKELATQAYLRTEDWIIPIDLNPASVEYVIRQFGAGAYSDVVGTIDYVSALMNEEQPLRSQELPVARRFYRGFTDEQREEAVRQADLRDDRRETGKEDKALRTERDRTIRTMKKMSVEERVAVLDAMEAEEPRLYNAVTREIQKQSQKATYPKRIVDLGGLGVENGQRAREMYRTMKRMKTAEERKEYLDQAEEAGHFSRAVRRQLSELISSD